MKVRLGVVFMFYGLGYFMGIDIYDVGGYLEVCIGEEEVWYKKYYLLNRLDK